MRSDEHLAQSLLVKWFRLQYPLMAKCLFAIPNGGARHIGTAIKLKDEGVTAGVADLFLMIPSNGKHGLFLEMKKEKGAKIQQNQLEFLSLAESMGYGAEVAYGFEEGVEKIKKYLQDG
jgi:hypothetical protein